MKGEIMYMFACERGKGSNVCLRSFMREKNKEKLTLDPFSPIHLQFPTTVQPPHLGGTNSSC